MRAGCDEHICGPPENSSFDVASGGAGGGGEGAPALPAVAEHSILNWSEPEDLLKSGPNMFQ